MPSGLERVFILVRQMARQEFIRYNFVATTLYRGAGIQTYVCQYSCTRLGPLNDALPTELQRHGNLCRVDFNWVHDLSL